MVKIDDKRMAVANPLMHVVMGVRCHCFITVVIMLMVFIVNVMVFVRDRFMLMLQFDTIPRGPGQRGANPANRRTSRQHNGARSESIVPTNPSRQRISREPTSVGQREMGGKYGRTIRFAAGRGENPANRSLY